MIGRDRTNKDDAPNVAISDAQSGRSPPTVMPMDGDLDNIAAPTVLTRYIEAGALLKFAHATGETDPIFTGTEGSDRDAEHLIAPPTYVATFCEVLAGVFMPHPEHNMFLHSADAVVNYEPIRPGDTITARAELVDIKHKIGSRGPTTVQRGMVTLTNQHGRTVSTVEVEMRSFSTHAMGRENG